MVSLIKSDFSSDYYLFVYFPKAMRLYLAFVLYLLFQINLTDLFVHPVICHHSIIIHRIIVVQLQLMFHAQSGLSFTAAYVYVRSLHNPLWTLKMACL